MRSLTTAASVAIVALAVVAIAAGCVTSTPATPSPPSAAPADPGPAIDLDALLSSAADKDGQVVRVSGFALLADAAQLCSTVLESYPPQCGAATVDLSGTIPADVIAAMDKTTDPALAQATWGWVEVLGTFTTASGPAIEISEIRLVAR